MEELGLADETLVGAVLNEAESIGDMVVVVYGLRRGGRNLNIQKFCESHSLEPMLTSSLKRPDTQSERTLSLLSSIHYECIYINLICMATLAWRPRKLRVHATYCYLNTR